ITGGNRGIGLGIAQSMADSGHRVAVTHRTGDAPEGLFGVRCDVTDTAQVDVAFTEVEAEQGPVDILIANARMVRDNLLVLMTVEGFSVVSDSNLSRCVAVAGRPFRCRAQSRFGRSILRSSVLATCGPQGQANYAAAKCGMIVFAPFLDREVGGYGIT